MWMSERTGSSWVTDLLNSHPDVTLGGEGSTCNHENRTDQHSCLQRLCSYFSLPVGQLSDPHCPKVQCPKCCPSVATRVRGVKQKLFVCNGESVSRSAVFAASASSPRNATNALDVCLQPPEQGRPWVRETHEVLTGVGARVICSMRRNAFELALSSYMLRIMNSRCHTSNIYAGTESQTCWDRVKSQGVHVDEAAFMGLLRANRDALEFQRTICETIARSRPTFFLWYEDLAGPQFARTIVDLQSFLTLKPISLSGTAKPVKAGESYSFVLNLQQLEAAARQP